MTPTRQGRCNINITVQHLGGSAHTHPSAAQWAGLSVTKRALIAAGLSIAGVEVALYALNIGMGGDLLFSPTAQFAGLISLMLCVSTLFWAAFLGPSHPATKSACVLFCLASASIVFKDLPVKTLLLSALLLAAASLIASRGTRRESIALLLSLILGAATWSGTQLAVLPIMQDCARHAKWICSLVALVSVFCGVSFQIAEQWWLRRWIVRSPQTVF